MDELPTNAHISEIGGAYYKVRLDHVPRVGELIDLYSFVDDADGRPPSHWYEVVQVVHELHEHRDVCNRSRLASRSHHFVLLHVKKFVGLRVKKSESEYFNITIDPPSEDPAVNNSAE